MTEQESKTSENQPQSITVRRKPRRTATIGELDACQERLRASHKLADHWYAVARSLARKLAESDKKTPRTKYGLVRDATVEKALVAQFVEDDWATRSYQIGIDRMVSEERGDKATAREIAKRERASRAASRAYAKETSARARRERARRATQD